MRILIAFTCAFVVAVSLSGVAFAIDDDPLTAKDQYINAHVDRLAELAERAGLNCSNEKVLRSRVNGLVKRMQAISRRSGALTKLMGARPKDMPRAIKEAGEDLIFNLCNPDDDEDEDDDGGDGAPEDDFFDED